MMRVLSFIPALLFAVASFVAAAPAPAPTCVSNPTDGNGSDAALHPVIAIITNATNNIQPLSDQLSRLDGDSCNPTIVSGIVIQIDAVVATCIAQLQATAEVELTGLNLTNLTVAIYGLLSLVATVLNTLVTIVFALRGNAVGTVQTTVSQLLTSVTLLVGCLQYFVVASATGVLGPVITLLNTVAGLLLNIVLKVSVSVN